MRVDGSFDARLNHDGKHNPGENAPSILETRLWDTWLRERVRTAQQGRGYNLGVA